MFSYVLLVVILSKQADLKPAISSLLIYKDYVEISRPLNPVEKFDEQDWQSIDPQSIYVRNCGKPYTLRYQHIEKGGVGQNVTVAVNSKQGVQMVKHAVLVDSELGLLVSVDSQGRKKYFYENTKSSEYGENPLNSFTLLTIETRSGQCQDGASINYVQKNMKWIRNHELIIEDDGCILTTWATIVNHGSSFKYGDLVELIAESDSHLDANRLSLRSHTKSASTRLYNDYLPIVNDLHGIKVFTLDRNMTILAKESIRMPIILQQVEVKRAVIASNTLTYMLDTNGRFNRLYDIVLKDFIPDGRLVVREGSRIVGRSNIAVPIPSGEKYRIKLGIDLDVIYNREIKSTLARNNHILYSLKLTFSNKRNESISIEYFEELSSKSIVYCRRILELYKYTHPHFTCDVSRANKAAITGQIDGNHVVNLQFDLLVRKQEDMHAT
ncbi:hypothetical protein GJ496_000121 [Pomphorhynchus laevis]|nr:hypothetical protein GJ496_000121 [Pomphorhynchus laevis]